MASIEKRIRNGRTRWYARYRDPSGKQRTKTFDRKVDAERFVTSTESRKLSGEYVDPDRGKLPVGEMAERWLLGKVNLKPTTRARYEAVLNVHLLPRWRDSALSRVDHLELQRWAAELSATQSGASVRKIVGVMSAILDLALRDKRISANPCSGLNLPRADHKRRRYLTAPQVAALAAAAGRLPDGRPHRRTDVVFDQYRVAILVLAYCGLRWSELAALRASSVDLTRRRIEISAAMTEVDGEIIWGTPKTHERRSVPLPRFLADDLRQLLMWRDTDDLLFTSPTRKVLRNRAARRDWFNRAATVAGVPGLTPHELRHTAASLAISAGANVKAVQRMLGHASAAMTLDLYADLFEDDLDEVAERLDELARRATQSADEAVSCQPHEGGLPSRQMSSPAPRSW